MSKLFFLMFTVLCISNEASSITLEIDGIEHSCSPTSTPIGNAATCANLAYSGPFSREECTRLCAGARNNGPAECALEAYSGIYSREESLNLCFNARSVGPAKCATLAYSGPFSRSETLELCGDPRATTRIAECALEAYAGVYSRQESIDLCKLSNQNKSSMAAIFSLEKSKTQLEEIIIRANIKAVQNNEYK